METSKNPHEGANIYFRQKIAFITRVTSGTMTKYKIYKLQEIKNTF